MHAAVGRPSIRAGFQDRRREPDVPSRRYEFRVAGSISPRSRDAFPDMVVTDAPPDTIIVGEVVDDSHLHGVLALIGSLGLRVVSMHEVPPAS
jgi:hypothetical protein